MKSYVIYKHISPSGKIYIGQTCQSPKQRWNGGIGYKHSQHFYNAILKYGWDNISHEIICEGLNKKEAALENNFDSSTITKCCKGKKMTHKGFIWKYKEIKIEGE